MCQVQGLLSLCPAGCQGLQYHPVLMLLSQLLQCGHCVALHCKGPLYLNILQYIVQSTLCSSTVQCSVEGAVCIVE